MLNAIQIVTALFLMMAVGYYFAAKGILNETVATFISKLIVVVSVPASAIDNMLRNFDKTMLGDAAIAACVSVGTILSCLALAYGIVRVFRVQKGRRGVLTVMIACANTIFIGLPVSQALFGEAASAYVLIYDMGHALMFWTLGVYIMSRDGHEKQPFFSMKTLKKLLSPGLLGLLAAIILVMLEVELPVFAAKTVSYFGGLCTPLALLYVGYVLKKTGLKQLRFGKDMLLVILGRIVILPALFLLTTKLCGLPQDMSKVFVAVAAMPVMNSIPIVAGEYGSDDAFSSQCLAVTMILSLLTMPLLMLLFQYIF